MKKQERGATIILILVVVLIVLIIAGAAANILISDEGAIHQVKKTVKIEQKQNENANKIENEIETKKTINNMLIVF